MLTFYTSISNKKYKESYHQFLNTWDKIPYDIYMYADEVIDGLPSYFKIENIKDYTQVPTGGFSKSKIGVHAKKSINFWYKGFATYHGVKNCETRYAVWLDADVSVKSFPELESFTELNGMPWGVMRYLHPDDLKRPTSIESGLIVFDTHHPDMPELIENYYNYWRLGTIKQLLKPYDNYVADAVCYDFAPYNFNLNNEQFNFDNGKIIHNPFNNTAFEDNLCHHIGKAQKKEPDNVITRN